MPSAAESEDFVPPKKEPVGRTSAFFCLPGQPPIELHLNKQCRWPIHPKPKINPLLEPTTTLQCGAPREAKGDGLHIYCKHHRRMAGRGA